MNFSISFGRDSKPKEVRTGKALTLPAPAKPTQTVIVPNRGNDWHDKKMVRMYAAAQMNRLTADWGVSISSANSEIYTSALATRSRMRQLERDDDYMRRMLRLFENNVVGHQGINLTMKIRDTSAKNDANKKFKFDSDANQKVLAAWKKYLKPENCTVSRNMSGVKVQRLAERCLKRDGAVMVRLWRGFENAFKFAIQPLEIDFLNFYENGINPKTGNRIWFGIEFDRFSAPVAYYILNRHPGEVFGQFESGNYQERVPADEILMLSDPDRCNQLYGMPDFCSIATRVNALHKYEEAEGVAARVAACKGGVIEKTIPTEYAGPSDQRGNHIEELSPGVVEELEVGETWKDIDPKHPMEAYGNFVKGQLRGAAAGAALNYNDVANDYEGVNYSSLKAGRLESKSQYEYDQVLLIEQLLQPWIEAWLPFAILSGQIGMPMDKLQKISDGIGWQPRTWQSVEPLKEVQADAAEIEAGLASRREKIAERGRNIDDVDEEREEDKASEDDHGLTPPEVLDPKLASGGMVPGTQPKKPRSDQGPE